ncbi:LysR family transcriptional regulator [Saccharopolyspora sp. WRP15-2]|uniref:LysR family transcriptional regulator n=1 Tax=Saccharopolyspora oryzae TaxID=2997343 RepID=A0ABT4UQA5_9PSEU|nr:LysR family transcriptional regulator [Saccharopolyspora oryzae]MDA3623906.1 LysR family transcriptional regulator [Saccharopolyspora oryzae]
MGTQITLQQLQYFLSAVEHGSLSAAAEAHFVAQPSLSEQIRRLERQLGVTLFHRTNRKLIVTDAARMLIPHAERTIKAAEEATASVDPARTLTGGTVAFGTFSSAHHLLHTDLVAQFRALYPQVRMRLLGHNSVQVADSVRDGQLEAGLVALPVDDRGLDVGPVEWVAEAVYLSRTRSRVRRPLSIQEVAESELILPEVRWGDTDPTRRQLLTHAQNAGVALRPIVEVESPATALALAEQGVGDTVISLPLAHALGSTANLHWNSLQQPLHETFAFITRRGAALSPATEIVIRLARKLLQNLPHSARLPA